MDGNHDRILTTHVGSLVRPPDLAAMLLAQQTGEGVDEQSFETCLEAAVADVIEKQVDTGIDIVNDGEFGKTVSWSRYVVERLSGFVQEPQQAGNQGMPKGVYGKDRRDFSEFYAEYDKSQGFVGMTGWVVDSPIAYTGQEAVQRDISNLANALGDVSPVDAFMPVVAPSSIIPDRDDQYYSSDEDYLFALADAMHEEYKAIVEAGFIAQIDDAYLTSYYDIIVPPGSMADYRKWAAVRVDALNHALRDLPQERTRYHVCWGSWNGPHTTDVPLRDIVDLVLDVEVGGYLLEMANPRHDHEWHVWEETRLPEGRVLIPGVISHATNIVEHPELVAERIIRLANLVGRENVIASTDCGFAQGPFVQRVHPTIMWAKLGAMVEGARMATKALWA
jgi:5-methyltetrahydropteroyltriglutamate--homocysteine methyltransferase